MRVGIRGSGLMGSKIGTIFARPVHDVTFSYSRGRQKLEWDCSPMSDEGAIRRPSPRPARGAKSISLSAACCARFGGWPTRPGFGLSGEVPFITKVCQASPPAIFFLTLSSNSKYLLARTVHFTPPNLPYWT